MTEMIHAPAEAAGNRLDLGSPPNSTEEEWLNRGHKLGEIETSLHWMIGDWIDHGARQLGQTHVEWLKRAEYSHGTLRNIASVARRFDLSRRRDKSTFIRPACWGGHERYRHRYRHRGDGAAFFDRPGGFPATQPTGRAADRHG